MSVRPAVRADAKEIRKVIYLAADPEHNPDFDSDGVAAFSTPNEIEAIKSRILDPAYLTLCCLRQERIVGVITMHDDEVIYQLFVVPEWQNKKIASQLWLEAKRICAQRGNPGQYWVKSSTRAVPVYQSFGFQLQGERQNNNGIVFYQMRLTEKPVPPNLAW